MCARYAFGVAVVLASTVRATVRGHDGGGEQGSGVLHPRRSRARRLVVPAVVLALRLYVLVRSLPGVARMAV